MRNFLWLVLAGVMLSGVAQAAPTFWDKVFGSSQESRTLVVPAQPAASGDVVEQAQPQSEPAFSLASDYKLGPGDRLSITVFNEKELSVEAKLTDAGTLSYPLLGEIRAQGMTIGKLQELLTQQLKSGYLVNPQVYVTILEYRQFFVNGEVNKPGGFAFQPGLTVRKAISLAGGFTPRASYTKIFIIHEDDPLGRARPATLDTLLRPGDILTIEQSFF